MPQKLSGGCACSAIRYECDADPVIMMNCHCRDCQKASGSAYAAIVVVPKGAVKIRGEPRLPSRPIFRKDLTSAFGAKRKWAGGRVRCLGR